MFQDGLFQNDDHTYDVDDYCFQESISENKTNWKLFVCQSTKDFVLKFHFVCKFQKFEAFKRETNLVPFQFTQYHS